MTLTKKESTEEADTTSPTIERITEAKSDSIGQATPSTDTVDAVKVKTDTSKPDQEVAPPLWQKLQLSPVPSVGYRIHHQDAWTVFSKQGGFQAPKPWWGAPTELTLREAVTDHMNWYSEVRSPFVSVLLDKQHAVNWARKWYDNRGGKCSVVTVDLTKVYAVYEVKQPVEVLAVNVPNHVKPNTYADELYALHQIPADAVVYEEEVEPGTITGSPSLLRTLAKFDLEDAMKALGIRENATK